jgi:hypothetical protein
MTTDPSSYDGLTRERRDSDGYRDGYAEAKRAFLIGQAIRGRGLLGARGAAASRAAARPRANSDEMSLGPPGRRARLGARRSHPSARRDFGAAFSSRCSYTG